MTEIADIIVDVLKGTKPGILDSGQPSRTTSETTPDVIKKSLDRVQDLLKKHPLYPELKI